MKEINFCPITGQLFEEKKRDKDGFYYRIKFLGEEFEFTFCEECLQKIPFEEIKHILRGLMLSRRLNDINGKIIHWDDHKNTKGAIDLKKLLDSLDYPKNPKDKIDNLITELFKLQTYDGEVIKLNMLIKADWNKLFFKSQNEFLFYLKTLAKQGDIEIARDGSSPRAFNFTYQGITNYIRRLTEGFNSNKCFVAMAFSDDMKESRNAIKSALLKTGFDPIVIDEKDIESDKTINDAIISNLRQCKFCIADFTHHRNGVYFESGFALGQGKQVIYVCEETQFKNAHFDIKPLQHIIYKTPDELEKKLIDKIEAWIK